ncbi:methylated-DNA--[protein]-cysteine S-methyltransferase [[Clostridium] symbiosum]|uniref:methylated-DNA--[protein]-cysteine S-methyltransferase n=1 Tax=Clostridium symbiosum TaxID=1512 RepID=UPI001D06803B|nr:methylated-DNA--[protein]-cysteine S-methyltransferase [[Clostridium] symbiosum]MCB6608812.1 methylated-DNA--[protein]-cysteine S-methyltransferase [[Clostridium] symbiosum]MCB6929586.1 methylated-DNA--[protein]-cysteine S-methyltransferase [[Clostridium] symbiosum]
MRYTIQIETPIGPLLLAEENNALTEISFAVKEPKTFQAGRQAESVEQETPLLLETKRQLEEYFAGTRRTFDIPLSMRGTSFQKKVWDQLLTVPYGETITYGEIAARIGNPRAGRAVGMANHHNPIPIIVPCHRVIGADGRLTGYGGGLPIKEKLLELEQKHRGTK